MCNTGTHALAASLRPTEGCDLCPFAEQIPGELLLWAGPSALSELELLGTLAQVTLIRGRGAGGRTEGFSCEKPGKSEQREKSADEGVVSTRPFQDPRGRCRSGRSHGIQEAVTCGTGILLNDRREASSHGTGAGSGPSHCEGIGRRCQMTAPQGWPPRKGAVPREKACCGLALCY